MRQEIKDLIDDVKRQIESRVAVILGPNGRKRFKNEQIVLESYDMVCDDYYLEPFKLKQIIVDDGVVEIQIEDQDGDKEWEYLRDRSLGEIQKIISLL